MMRAGPTTCNTRFESSKPFVDPLFDTIWGRQPAFVESDAVARRSAEELIDGHAERFSCEIPECLFHAAECACEDGTRHGRMRGDTSLASGGQHAAGLRR